MERNHMFVRSLLEPNKLLISTTVVNRMSRIYVFQPDLIMKSTDIDRWVAQLNDPPESIDYFLNTVDDSFIDGFIIYPHHLMFVNKHVITYLSNFVFGPYEYIELRDSFKGAALTNKGMDQAIQHAQDQFQFGKEHLNIVRSIHNQSVRKTCVKQWCDDIHQYLFSSNHIHEGHRELPNAYYGSHSSKGPVFANFNALKYIHKQLILKGVSNPTKSHILARIAQSATEQGYVVSKLYCPLYPDDIDVLLIPELEAAVVDSVPPHSIEPVNPKDRVFHFDHDCLEQTTLFSQTPEINEASSKYSQHMRQGMLSLQKAKKYMDQVHYNTLEQDGHFEGFVGKLNQCLSS
ncbi:hypothetical protein [Tuberibacillus sp. Marseille-P3662]|uniref:hypothetical protein n=1 Tax=Tuberibacillus sp. Marseille-P3662 TaxID=1965358 RepID=UPI000A1CD336|nr:hypothetical protein [Tuberibacillus sp. Marseille-P3662]